MAYLPLSTANLPNPAIDPAQGSSPADYFNTVLYTGNGTSGHAITGVGFEPSFVWLKERADTGDHHLFDQVRGLPSFLSSNKTDAENTTGSQLLSFDSDGFTLNAGGGINENTQPVVAWNWKANGSGVSNIDGSITSTVSANTTSGFSVVTFTSNGSSGQTIGHGLGVAPKMVIAKNRSSTGNWWVYNYNIGNANYMELNTTIASTGGANVWSSTHPSSTVVYSGLNSLAPTSGHEVVMYCFAEVENFSKFGSFSGNNSTDGPFIYLGFRPALFMVKCTNTTGSWYCYDTTRLNYNVMGSQGQPIAWDTTAGEDTGADASWYVDALSNGIKIRNNSNFDNGTNSFIYMAFAENPFKFSLAR